MPEPCAKCPCPETCLQWSIFCAWAAEESADPIKLKHICGRSALGNTPVAYPPLAQQAANLGRALWDWAVSGFSMTSQDEQARRLEICRGCEQWDGGRCRICGCGLAAKIALKTSHCPLPEPKW